MKKIILCADDYGQNQSISQAIIQLIEKKRLSATSCMTNAPEWDSQAKWLHAHQDTVDIGLHLNFTEGQPLSTEFSKKYGGRMLPLSKLLISAFLKKLNKKVLLAEIHAQIDSFIDSIGRLPDFIDGHQHTHQFPVIRDALLEAYDQRFKGKNIYLRNVFIKSFDNEALFKKWIIHYGGGRSFKVELQKNKIPHNSSFSGIYDFIDNRYDQKFNNFLSQIKHKGLIMCHPGLKNENNSDGIHQARLREFEYLMSNAFLDACAANDVKIERFCCI